MNLKLVNLNKLPLTDESIVVSISATLTLEVEPPKSKAVPAVKTDSHNGNESTSSVTIAVVIFFAILISFIGLIVGGMFCKNA